MDDIKITAEMTQVHFTTCTPELRWIDREFIVKSNIHPMYNEVDAVGKRIDGYATTVRSLQQKWQHETMPPSDVTFEWRDVPVVAEKP